MNFSAEFSPLKEILAIFSRDRTLSPENFPENEGKHYKILRNNREGRHNAGQ
ncbi:hypothetical protein [Spirulina sp. 06S082]|uniref:hypothetical protein n=1 Tax=Spirulina sp. 06S082 TaxID=3110248 RepID=UPI002B213CAE|nr:hypothetical protein [Spirulina sp. 06S082]MEA5468819.1 hypothetical protein [Spirulina sp. 06S082]